MLDKLKLVEFLEEKREWSHTVLKEFGEKCSRGKCAQSRIHLIDEILEYMESML